LVHLQCFLAPLEFILIMKTLDNTIKSLQMEKNSKLIILYNNVPFMIIICGVSTLSLHIESTDSIILSDIPCGTQ